MEFDQEDPTYAFAIFEPNDIHSDIVKNCDFVGKNPPPPPLLTVVLYMQKVLASS